MTTATVATTHFALVPAPPTSASIPGVPGQRTSNDQMTTFSA
jgi:hypothetical protein